MSLLNSAGIDLTPSKPFRSPASSPILLLHIREIKSYRTGVQENSDAGTEALGRKVVDETCSDDAGVSVRPCDFAPDDSDLAALSFLVGAVDESDSLA